MTLWDYTPDGNGQILFRSTLRPRNDGSGEMNWDWERVFPSKLHDCDNPNCMITDWERLDLEREYRTGAKVGAMGRKTVIQRIWVEAGVIVPLWDSFGNTTILYIGDSENDWENELVSVHASGPGWVDIERDVAPSLANEEMGKYRTRAQVNSFERKIQEWVDHLVATGREGELYALADGYEAGTVSAVEFAKKVSVLLGFLPAPSLANEPMEPENPGREEGHPNMHPRRQLRQRFRRSTGEVVTPSVVYEVTTRAYWNDGTEAVRWFLQYGFGDTEKTAGNASSGVADDILLLEEDRNNPVTEPEKPERGVE